MPPTSGPLGAYRQVDVETASQGKLIVMLFNGAIQRAEEAKRRMAKNDRAGAHENLIRAQDIIAELRNALNMQAGEVAQNLDRIYEYFQHLLIQANIRKKPDLADECIVLMTTMRDTWEEVFKRAGHEQSDDTAPRADALGAKVMNIQG